VLLRWRPVLTIHTFDRLWCWWRQNRRKPGLEILRCREDPPRMQALASNGLQVVPATKWDKLIARCPKWRPCPVVGNLESILSHSGWSTHLDYIWQCGVCGFVWCVVSKGYGASLWCPKERQARGPSSKDGAIIASSRHRSDHCDDTLRESTDPSGLRSGFWPVLAIQPPGTG